MITINAKDYTTEQLKYLVDGLCFTQAKFLRGTKYCMYHLCTKDDCKAYEICTDIGNTLHYLREEIKKREAFESYQNTQENE